MVPAKFKPPLFPVRFATVRVMVQTARQWLASYAAELGIDPPDENDMAQLLDLAAVAARASERTAAPITC